MYIGELSAILASFIWATGATFFTLAVRNIGPHILNVIRLNMAFLFLLLSLYLTEGVLYPIWATFHNWLWLGISGIIGLVIGDICYFGALNYLGVRITMLLFTLSPPAAALSEYIILKDPISVGSMLGMFVVIGGIIIVVYQNKDGKNQLNLHYKVGILLGVLAALFQGVGLTISRLGISGVNAIEATYIRMLCAATSYSIFFLIFKRHFPYFENKKGRTAYMYAVLGAFFGPFLGVVLSMNAIKFTHSGVAQTLLSTTPITIIPYSIFVFKEKIGVGSLLGTIIAFAGVVIMIWVK